MGPCAACSVPCPQGDSWCSWATLLREQDKGPPQMPWKEGGASLGPSAWLRTCVLCPRLDVACFRERGLWLQGEPCVGRGPGGHPSVTPVTAQGAEASVLLGGLGRGAAHLGVPAERPPPWETRRPASDRPGEGLCPGFAGWGSPRWDRGPAHTGPPFHTQV